MVSQKGKFIHLPSPPIYRCLHSPTLVFREGQSHFWVISTPEFWGPKSSQPWPVSAARGCIAWTSQGMVNIVRSNPILSTMLLTCVPLAFVSHVLDVQDPSFFCWIEGRWDDDQFWRCLWWVGWWLFGPFEKSADILTQFLGWHIFQLPRFLELMVDWWFGAQWFGIRIGVPLSNHPGPQTTKPNH